MTRFGIRFPEICFEKFIIFELSSQIYVKIKELDNQLKSQQFSLITYQKFNYLDEKICREATCLLFFLLLKSAIFHIFASNNFRSFISAIAFVCIFTYLEDLSPEKCLLIKYDNQNKNEHFCDWKRQYLKWSFVSDWT